jgi:hypothetical protein
VNQEDLEKSAYSEHLGRWYSWDSPIGLGLFFVSLAVVAVLVHYAIILR